MLYCVRTAADGFKLPYFARIGTHRVLELDSLNQEIEGLFKPFREFRFGGRQWYSVEIVNFDNYNSNPYKFDFIFNLLFDEIMVTRAVVLSTDFLTRNDSGEKDPFLVSFENHSLFDFSDEVKLDTEIFSLSGVYVLFTVRPKFDIIGLNSRGRINFQYIDANQILLKYYNKVFNIVLFVYRHYEDDRVYFIIYNISILQERQVIRHEEMKFYSENMRVNVAQFKDNSLLILIHDFRKRMVFKSYVYTIITKMIAKTTDNIVINGQTLPLLLVEDDSVENNTYEILHPLIIDLNGQNADMISLKIRNFIAIKGNVIHMRKPEGLIPAHLDRLVTFKDFIYPETHPTFIGISELENKSRIRVIFNSRFMIGNFDDPNQFDLYLNSNMRRYTKLVFDFENNYRYCLELMISEKHFFCLYTGFNKFYIKAKALNQSKVDLFKVEIQAIQQNFQLLVDDQQKLMFISTFKHRHGVRIEVVNKDTLLYEYINLEPKDFGTSDLNLISVNYHFDEDNSILTVIGYSNLKNILYVFTARLDFAPFRVNKLKTLRNSFEINDIDVNISELLCKSKV